MTTAHSRTSSDSEDAEYAEGAEAAPRDTLLLTEVYASVQGESTYAGIPFVIVRTARCNLRCVWCDSEFTFKGGERRKIDDIVAQVLGYGLTHVLVTGGEPLLQPQALPLMTRLCDARMTVLLETSGALDISRVDPRVHRIVDVKCPGSGESARNLWSNLVALTPRDEVKFVIADRADYEWARDVVRREDLPARCGSVLFSPVWGDPRLPGRIAEWVLEDRLAVRLQVQLHKILWNPTERAR